MASSGVKELERPGRTINGTTTCIIDTDDSTSDEASVGKKTASQKHVITMTPFSCAKTRRRGGNRTRQLQYSREKVLPLAVILQHLRAFPIL